MVEAIMMYIDRMLGLFLLVVAVAILALLGVGILEHQRRVKADAALAECKSELRSCQRDLDKANAR